MSTNAEMKNANNNNANEETIEDNSKNSEISSGENAEKGDNEKTGDSSNKNNVIKSSDEEFIPIVQYTPEEVIAALPPHVLIPTSRDVEELCQEDLDSKFEDYFVALYTASEWISTGYESRETTLVIRKLADKARARRKMEEEKLEKIKTKFEADMKTMKEDQAKFEKVHWISARRIQIEKERVRAMATSEYYRYNDITPKKEVIDKLVAEYEADFKKYSRGQLAKEVERLASDRDMKTPIHTNQWMAEPDEDDIVGDPSRE